MFQFFYSIFALCVIGCEGLVQYTHYCGSNIPVTKGYGIEINSVAYRNNMDCSWVIIKPGPYRVVFTRFYLEDQSTCQYDYVTINGGPRRCGSKPWHSLNIMDNPMTVRFHTDGSVTKGGFKLYLYSTGCEVELWEHTHYRGRMERYNTNTRNVGYFNDKASSIKVSNGCCVRIYDHSSWRGRQEVHCSKVGNLGVMNDRVTSFKIYRSAVNGGWSGWSGFGGCSRSCGGGSQSRTRTCNNPSPRYGGRNCVGSSTNQRSCNANGCPVNGGWSGWSGFGGCSRSCGGGSQSRTRTCNNPSPRYGGRNCVGSSTNQRSCNANGCPVNGGWGSWSEFGGCSAPCGSGVERRTRQCNNPTPLFGGTQCQGPLADERSCKLKDCPECKLETLGCFAETIDRVMPEELLNERDETSQNYKGTKIDWNNYEKAIIGLACRCAKIAKSKGYEVIGLQNYGECWSGPKAHETFEKHGKSDQCVNGKGFPKASSEKKCDNHIGIGWTNHVYRVAVPGCAEHNIEPVGCYKGAFATMHPTPTPTSTMMPFGEMYEDIPEMLCECAEAARKRGHAYFAMQPRGKCLSGRTTEVEFHSGGNSDQCEVKEKSCRCNSYVCVGKGRADYVYKLKEPSEIKEKEVEKVEKLEKLEKLEKVEKVEKEEKEEKVDKIGKKGKKTDDEKYIEKEEQMENDIIEGW